MSNSAINRNQRRRTSVRMLFISLTALWMTNNHASCTVQAFSRPANPFSSSTTFAHRIRRRHPSPTVVLFANDDPNNNDESNDNKNISNEQTSVLDRFLNPQIDDRALPLSDALVSQIIAPSIQVAWLSLNHAPSPTWLRPFFESSVFYDFRGALVAPALIHGAALASCWLVGALAARAYEIDALIPDRETKSYLPVFSRVLQAGAFATGVLILGTQLDLYREFGNMYVQYGDSPETDFRIQVAVVEIINDVFFEAVSLLTWRLFLAVQTERSGRL